MRDTILESTDFGSLLLLLEAEDMMNECKEVGTYVRCVMIVVAGADDRTRVDTQHFIYLCVVLFLSPNMEYIRQNHFSG